MESAAARRMLDQMAQALPRDGYLVMGAGEQGGAMSESLRPLGASVYAPKPAISAAA
jgi:chemotaxis methyl-accepting protein methylase